MTPDIEADDLSLRYGNTTALDGLTFALESGRIYGLLGRNGAGKSSLLSVLAGFRRPSTGQVRVGGQPVFENPGVMRQVCLIRESGDTVESSERVSAALRFAGRLRPGWDAGYATDLAERLGLPLDKRLSALSRGQRSALGVVLGLASRAPVTMLDESYLGMDAPSRYAFYDALLADFMAHPRTLIISTHLIEEVSSLFERVVIISAGRLLLHEDIDELRSRGAAVTGPNEAVERFVAAHTVLGRKRLGPTTSATVYGPLDEAQRRQARGAGLELGPVGLQDLFVHLTAPTGGTR